MRMTRLVLAPLLMATALSAEARAQAGGVQLKLAGPTIWVKMDTVSAWVLVPGSAMEVFRKAGEA